MDNLEKIDHSAIKSNQAVIISLNIIAFWLNLPWLALLVAIVMAFGTIFRQPGFSFIYKIVLKPLGWTKPDLRLDHHEPHNFSQGLGSLMMGAGALGLYLGASLLGWTIVWTVTALGALNLFAGFCVGCMIYYWLNRLDIPNFQKSPPPGTFPGKRPEAKVFDES